MSKEKSRHEVGNSDKAWINAGRVPGDRVLSASLLSLSGLWERLKFGAILNVGAAYRWDKELGDPHLKDVSYLLALQGTGIGLGPTGIRDAVNPSLIRRSAGGGGREDFV